MSGLGLLLEGHDIVRYPVREAFAEGLHPRGYHGRFIGSGESRMLHVMHGGTKVGEVKAPESMERVHVFNAVAKSVGDAGRMISTDDIRKVVDRAPGGKVKPQEFGRASADSLARNASYMAQRRQEQARAGGTPAASVPGLTYRERREARAERLRGWAAKREARAASSYETSRARVEQIPLGEPIHSRADANRRQKAFAGMERSFADQRKAEGMRSRAAEIDRQAAASIYSDDPNAPAALRAKIADLEGQVARIKAYNASARKAAKSGGTGDRSLLDASQQAEILTIARVTAYNLKPGGGFPAYVLTNLNGNLSRARKRLASLSEESAPASVLGALLEGFVAAAPGPPASWGGRFDVRDNVSVPVKGGEVTGRVLRASGARPDTHVIIDPGGGAPHVEAEVAKVRLHTPESYAAQAVQAERAAASAGGPPGAGASAGAGGAVRESAGVGLLLEGFDSGKHPRDFRGRWRKGDKVHVVTPQGHVIRGVVQDPPKATDVITSRGNERHALMSVKWEDGDVSGERPGDVRPGHPPPGAGAPQPATVNIDTRLAARRVERGAEMKRKHARASEIAAGTRNPVERGAAAPDGPEAGRARAAEKATRASTPYQVGQRIEHQRTNFRKPGMPREWHAGNVEHVEPVGNGLHDVRIRHNDGSITVERVGKRGGNRNLRKVQEAAPRSVLGSLLEGFAAAPPAPKETPAQSQARGARQVAAAQKSLAAGWNASKHPRAAGGKFGYTTGGKRATRSSGASSRTLGVGAKGALVKSIQRQLHIPADGVYGPQTRAAVTRYQQQHGLQVDGVVGAQTVAALRGNPNARSVKPGPIASRAARVHPATRTTRSTRGGSTVVTTTRTTTTRAKAPVKPSAKVAARSRFGGGTIV